MKPQTARVLAVMRHRPVTLADFDCQPACDGGDRITRLGARIQDLKDDGYRVDSQRVGHIARYTLIAEPETSGDRGMPDARPDQGACQPARPRASSTPAAADSSPCGVQASLFDLEAAA